MNHDAAPLPALEGGLSEQTSSSGVAAGAIESLQTEFDILFAHAPGALLLLDAGDVIVRANSAAHRMFDYADGVLSGLALAALVPAASQDTEGRRADGSTFVVSCEITPLGDAGGKLVVIQDISAQHHLHEVLRSANSGAEAALKAKTEFLGNMSHELRTPLNAVLGMTQLLDRTSLTSEQRKQVKMINQAGQALLCVLNDVLDLSGLDAGRIALQHQVFDLDTLLATVGDAMASAASFKALELVISAAHDTPIQLTGDPLRLQQILLNLVGNAIKFTHVGSVVLRVSVAVQSTEHITLRFSVQDTGIGMSEAQMADLFLPFTQADASATRKFGGLGIGLSICQRLLMLMGGTVTVSSVLQQGSEFVIEVPLARVQGEQRTDDGLRDQRMLIVSGQFATRSALEEAALRIGLRSASAESADQALALYDQANAAGQQGFDYIVMDCALTKAIVQDLVVTRTKRAKLIILANHTEHEDAQALLVAVNADGILASPFTYGRLGMACHIEPSHAAHASDDGSLSGYRILLVEDDPLSQIIATDFLEQAGAEVETADDGQQAVDAISGVGHKFDAIIMDVQMPVMNGHAATQYIRNTLGLSLPIIALSAGISTEERQKCTDAGMTGFIGKPVDSAHLVHELRCQLCGAEAALAPLPTAPSLSEGQGTYRFDAMLGMARNSDGLRRSLLASVRQLVSDGSMPMQNARALWQAGAREELSRLMHSLRGAVGNYGATVLADTTREIEYAVEHASPDVHDAAIDALLDKANGQYQHLLDAAIPWLQQQDLAAPAASNSVAPLSLEVLQGFIELLEAQSFAAIDEFEKLRAQLAAGVPSDAAAIEQLLDRLDFPAAAVRLRQAASKMGMVI